MDLNSYVQLYNYAGCGNTVNANHPAVKELILASLRHWVTEYHIDGFRFDLASVLCRDENGAPMESPPLIRAISKDPVLSKTKLIAEPWDCGGLFQVGSFPNWDRWVCSMLDHRQLERHRTHCPLVPLVRVNGTVGTGTL